tara:strand:- start:2713 stop:3081 length:369 start_codon:yes stop_codon:yes gene_type:complete
VTIDTKESIEQINEVSRQLLSRILSIHKSLQSPKKISPVEKTEDLLSNRELTDLASTRQKLITHLFEQNTTESISSQTVILQEMLVLDSELTTNSTICKQEIAEQVLKLKKSKKIVKSYQKY